MPCRAYCGHVKPEQGCDAPWVDESGISLIRPNGMHAKIEGKNIKARRRADEGTDHCTKLQHRRLSSMAGAKIKRFRQRLRVIWEGVSRMMSCLNICYLTIDVRSLRFGIGIGARDGIDCCMLACVGHMHAANWGNASSRS